MDQVELTITPEATPSRFTLPPIPTDYTVDLRTATSAQADLKESTVRTTKTQSADELVAATSTGNQPG